MDSEEPETGSIRAGSVKETHVAGLETAPPSHETGTEALLLNGNPDDLHRRLNNRQIQLIAIGGSIGTAIFVNIGNSLNDGGPASVLTAYLLYSLVMGMVNNCTAEMVTYAPVSGGFISLAAHWVDDAWGFMAGWNFFLYECLNIPFEITAVALCLGFWSDSIPPVAVCIACIALYGILNAITVRAYGEAEFWLSGGKVFLLLIVFCFTFITMVGGNPQGDAYGFRYWKNPGAFAEYRSTGPLGLFEGFLACLWNASFTIVGPEYISKVAAEAKHPRTYVKRAFKTAYWRFGVFYVGSALCVGIVIAYNDPTLVGVLSGQSSGSGTAAASPYVIAMRNLKVQVLPHLVNALLITSIFSAGNTYMYAAIRSLYALSIRGHAPKFLRKCTKRGIPVYCFAVVMVFPFLSLLTLGNSSAVVLSWLTNINTAAGVIDFIVISVTYICFYNACRAQGLDRTRLPYTGWGQPYMAYVSLGWMTFVVFTFGYSSFKPWSVSNFFICYTMLLLAPALFLGWKWKQRSRWLRPGEVDLVWTTGLITLYETCSADQPMGFWLEMRDLATLKHLRKRCFHTQ